MDKNQNYCSINNVCKVTCYGNYDPFLMAEVNPCIFYSSLGGSMHVRDSLRDEESPITWREVVE
jgi:hypothetical protein